MLKLTTILGEISHKQKDKYYMISIICKNIKNSTNESMYKIETDSQG